MLELAKAKLKSFLLKKLTPVLLPVMLIILIAGGIMDALSKVPIVGDKLAEDFFGEEFNSEANNEFGIINYEKSATYLEMEKASYPQNTTVESSHYEENLTGISDKSSQYLENLDGGSESIESVPFNIGDQTRPYRLWWQAIGGIDVVTGESSTLDQTDVIDTFQSELSPVFDYTYDSFYMSDFQYNMVIYNSAFYDVTIYEDGISVSNEKHQLNTTKVIPMPYINSVSTMFYDLTFQYSPIEIENIDWQPMDTSVYITNRYDADSSGSYVSVNGSYVLANSSNLVESTAHYEASSTGAYVNIGGTYYRYDPRSYSGMQRYDYIGATYRQRYKIVEVKTVTEGFQRSKTEGYQMSTTLTPNNRYTDFMNTHNFDKKLAEKDKDMIIDIATLFPDSYEFLYHANTYLGTHAQGMNLSGYSGTGNYRVMDPPGKYIVPIQYDSQVAEKQVKVTDTFGHVLSTINGVTAYRTHNGLDIGVPTGTPIIAAEEGDVVTSSSGYSEGNYVVILHADGFKTQYMHLSFRLVNVGDHVKKGDPIGISGATGNVDGAHLHFGIKDSSGAFVDPMNYIAIEPIQ